MNRRACHVLLCQDNESLDVITTIGQAFELRYNEFLRSQQQQHQSTEPSIESVILTHLISLSLHAQHFLF